MNIFFFCYWKWKIFLENEINLFNSSLYETCNEMPESMKEHESSCRECTSRNEINFKGICTTWKIEILSSWGCAVLTLKKNELNIKKNCLNFLRIISLMMLSLYREKNKADHQLLLSHSLKFTLK